MSAAKFISTLGIIAMCGAASFLISYSLICVSTKYSQLFGRLFGRLPKRDWDSCLNPECSLGFVKARTKKCKHCGGSGRNALRRSDLRWLATCEHCGGTGESYEVFLCPICRGKGRAPRELQT